MLPIIRFYVLYLLGAQVGFSLLMVFARNAGYTDMQLAVYGVFLYIVPVTGIPLLRRLPTRRSFALTLVLFAIAIGFMLQFHRGVGWYWLLAPVVGTSMISFWIVYLIRHVTAGPERANAYNSSVIVFTIFGVGCVAPLIAGLLASRFGSTGVVCGGLFLFGAAATQIRSIKPRTIHLRLRAAWPTVPRYAQVLLILQGMYEALQFLYLPMCTTLFLTEPMRFGMFFSVVAAISSSANILISRWSDRVGNRSRMIYIGCSLTALGAVGLATADGVMQWSLAAPLLQTGFTLMFPYFIAVTLDAVPDTDDAFVVREWGCNVGRLISVFVVLGLLRWTGNLQHAYFWALVPLAAYPAVLYVAGRRGLVVAPTPHPELTAATAADAQAEGAAS